MEGPSNGGLLYHEVQEAKLCAVHCVNTVLQGPFFSEVDLAGLASDLDQKEQQVMLDGSSASSGDFLSVGSYNVSLGGDFSIQVDAIRSALNAAGFPGVDVVVAETGWPYRGDADEVGTTTENARAFNGNLIAHLRSMAGTPLMPGKSVETYIFALYDEDLKPGPTSERSFGLFRTDLTMTYDAGLTATTAVAPSASPAGRWCVPKEEATDQELQEDHNSN